jgi:filamentous hemagglutinin family protein
MFVSGMVTRSGSRPGAEIPSGRRVFRPALLALALAAAFTGAHGQTNPVGGVAIHGQASFSSPTANQLNVVTQNGAGTSHSAINWQSFSIAPGSSTNFQQPSTTSTVINRVVTNTPSSIFGTLSSNGRLVLVNQSGIAVGAGAVIDTAGFAASALRMTDADALAGRLRFGNALGGISSSLSVDGRITARNGDVVLIAPNIDVGTSALIQSPNGSTVLAAGQQVEITGRGLEGISLLVQAPGDTVRNLGNLRGDAVGIFAGTLHHSGNIQATTASLEGGNVVLKASGDAYVEGAAKISATGSTGGQVDVLGNRVAVLGTALIDASGANGGGAIRVGGDYQGKNPDVPNAQMTYVGQGTALKADATAGGDGGKVIVWSDDVTRAHGSISANAGPAGGGGGFVETSGHRYLDVAGIRVAASGSAERPGTWLLDPSNVTITHGAAALLDTSSQTIVFGSVTETIFAPVDGPSTTSSLTDGDINGALNTNSNFLVVISTTNPSISGGQSGDITFEGAGVLIERLNAVNPNSSTLRLNADHDIVFKAGSDTTFRKSGSAGTTLTVELNPANQIKSEGITGPNAAAIVVLDGAAAEVSLNIKNGKVWDNFGSVTLDNLSVIRLPNESGYATFSNHAPDVNNPLGGVLNVNSSSPWSFLSDSGVQGGIVNNAGTVNVNGTNNGNTTAWEARFSNLSTGTLNLAATKLLSMQNMDTIAGSVVLGNASELRIPETHGGSRAFSNATFSGNGRITVNPGITSTFNGSLGSFGTLSVGGTVQNQTGALSVQNYLQTAGASVFNGAGDLSVTSGFNHTGGSFNPSGNVSIAQASGNLVFADTLNTTSINLSANAGALTVSNPLTSSGAMSLGAATGLTINALLNAGNTFDAFTAGPASVMTVNNQVFSGGAMNVNLAGGLTVQSAGSQTAQLSGGTGQTIQAKYVEVIASGTSSADIRNSAGVQSITTSGVNGTGDGVLVLNASSAGGNAFIDNTSANQTITVNNADFMRVVGQGGNAFVSTNGGLQTVIVQGSGQNSLRLGSATAIGSSRLDGPSQSITAGQTGQSGSILVQGGVADRFTTIRSSTGAQSIATPGGITLIGGTGVDGNSDSQAATATLDGSGTSQTVNAASITIQGGSGSSFNNAGIWAFNTGATQTINIASGGTLALTGGSSSGANNQATIYTSGTAQTINFAGSGNFQMNGGTNGSANGAFVSATTASTTQTVTGNATIALQGGASGSNNVALLTGNGNQSVTAAGIVLTGGAGGGGSGTGNVAFVKAIGNQNIVLGSGGLSLTGGGGSLTDNSAQVFQSGTSGTSQTITLNAGGSITAQGGSSLMTNVGGATHGSRALIEADGDTQTIHFTAGGAINLTGGATGSRAYALIYAANGNQSIMGPSNIVLTGGSSGGFAGEGNSAAINAQTGSQTISAGSIMLQGGTSGIENRANINASAGDQSVTANGISIQAGASGQQSRAGISAGAGNQTLAVGSGGLSLTGGSGNASEHKNYANVYQGGASKTQTVTVGGGGDITLQGGSSAGTNVGQDNGSFAFITSDGAAQLVEFSAPGSVISVTGGSVGSLNYAGFASRVGTQTIRGTALANAPTILLTGGASGGVAGEDNGAGFNSVGLQTISAGATSLQGGAGGVGNSAYITAPVQSLAFNGNLSLAGSNNGDANSGSRIGGRGSGNTDLHLNVTGNLSLAAGATSGVSVGASSGSTPGTNSAIVVDVTGDVILTPNATQGVRIGAPAAVPQTGSVAVTAGGDIVLNGGGGTAVSAIRSLGDVSLSAHALSIDGLVSGGTIYASGATGVTIGSVGQLSAGATSGDAIKVVTGTGNFTNMGGPTALSVLSGARWLVFSSDPALDTLDGLVFNFNQYETTFANANSVQGSGNGVVYRARAPGTSVETTADCSVSGSSSLACAVGQQVVAIFQITDVLDKAAEDTKAKKRKDAVVTEEEICR